MTEPRRIGIEAGHFVERSAAPAALEASRVLQAWDAIAGPLVLQRTQGGRYKRGELLVYVQSSAWANELQLMSETFRVRLNETLGKSTVRTIRFTVSERVAEKNALEGEARERRRRYERRSSGSPALSEDEERRVESIASEVTDDAVREALTRAMKATARLRRTKGETTR